MNYKVLYRKYRPSTFSGIVGQDYTVKMLKNAILHDKISHAYLFTGPRGTGKTSTAKIFAKTINCLNPTNGEACGQCANCLSFANSPDIIEIDAASNNGVDDVRELINNVKIAPSEGKYKIYIIDEVHMMTQSAFNALLLTLEEPPKHAIFIMATTNVENVPITILSRCQRFNFQKITLDDLKKQIKFVCSEENISITDDAVEEIAYLSEGGMRDALSLLDQLSSNSEEITLDKILTHYGSISTKAIKTIIETLEKQDIESLEKEFEDLESTSNDYKVFIKKMVQELMRIVMLIRYNRYEGNLTFSQIKKIVFEFNEILNKTNINMNPYVLIKLTLLGALETEEKDERRTIIFTKEEPIRKEEPKISPVENVSLKNDIVSDEAIEKLKKIRINNCFVAAKKDVLTQYQQIWKSFENTSVSPDYLAWIMDSTLVAASNEYAIIGTKLDSLANLINSKIEDFTKEIKGFFGENIHFIALSINEWENEKKKYVKNLKDKYTYQLMEETTDVLPKIEKKEENMVTDVFNHDKIEIV